MDENRVDIRVLMAEKVEGVYGVERGRLDGWCEGDILQQRDDVGGCTTIRERWEGLECSGAYVDD